MPLHMDICEAKGISWPIVMPTRFCENTWVLTACDRERELVFLGAMDGCSWIDTSQQLNRARPTYNVEVVATCMPGCHFFNFSLDRYLIGRDLLNLQGIPWPSLPQLSGYSEGQLADLAGNAFSTSVSLAFDVAVLLNLKYTTGASGDDDVAKCMLALAGGSEETQEFDWSD